MVKTMSSLCLSRHENSTGNELVPTGRLNFEDLGVLGLGFRV